MSKLEQVARQALEAIGDCSPNKALVNAAYALREALDRSGEADEMVVGWDRVKPEAIASDHLYQQGFVDGVEEGRNQVAEPELNLNCKSVQKRLATVWGYVKAEQAEQEPVLWQSTILPTSVSLVGINNDEWRPLYAAPVRTKDLTDEEIVSLANSVWFLDEMMLAKVNFARAVIAADREKNK